MTFYLYHEIIETLFLFFIFYFFENVKLLRLGSFTIKILHNLQDLNFFNNSMHSRIITYKQPKQLNSNRIQLKKKLNCNTNISI